MTPVIPESMKTSTTLTGATPNLRIWLLNVIDEPSELEDLRSRATWDWRSAYKSGDDKSAPLLLEYDAVVWKTSPQALQVDAERNRQLDAFLKRGSKVFVYLLDQAAPVDIVSSLLFASQPRLSKRSNKAGRHLELTPEGQLSPLRS